ncbi:aromatic-ring hydroxylase [Hyaloraphidium curvatum]|nr:aromatic-ring hydroxylase [Hyaloraphidium curvatum]
MSSLNVKKPDVDVVVVGGGIGGLATAFALTRKGLKVRVLERAPEFGEAGAGLQIAPNCTRILDDWGLLDEVVSLGVLPENIVARDAITGKELTRLDLKDCERRYGHPYLVIHRSDLHGVFLRACKRVGVDLVTNAACTGYENVDGGAVAKFGDRTERAELVMAADGMHSVARPLLSDDKPVSSSYVAYRGTLPADKAVRELGVSLKDVVVYVGPKCHLVQYPLRAGEMFNLVAVFESPKAVRGEADWGTPDELDGAFAKTHPGVRECLPNMWRDKWWRMFTREPIMDWVKGRIALTGDAAHPPLQYLAQGAVMAIEDAWVLSEHVGLAGGPKGSASRGTATGIPWERVLQAYNAVRPEHCRRVLTTAWIWGDLWHLEGEAREWRNRVFEERDIHSYDYVDWLYGPTALYPEHENKMFDPKAYEKQEAKKPASARQTSLGFEARL